MVARIINDLSKTKQRFRGITEEDCYKDYPLVKALEKKVAEVLANPQSLTDAVLTTVNTYAPIPTPLSSADNFRYRSSMKDADAIQK